MDFHPATLRWFAEALGAPTPVQERGWAAIREGRHTLIAAPTGSGKTLAAFLIALDDLLREGLTAELPDEVRVLYVSPLKALGADIHRNLAAPRLGIRQAAKNLGLVPPRITAAVRTGDTSQAERAAMLRQPPHILVTTPESLYLLLTAERSRAMLRTVRTVVIDEIHAVIGSRRGPHLALSLERLARVTGKPFARLGLSATQRPLEQVARYLVGETGLDAAGLPDCAIVNEGHSRPLDLGLEIPKSPLEAVMAHEVWEEYYDRLADLIRAHRTTLVFVNTRRLAERVARHLSDRLGADAVTAHHGSLSKEKRLAAEERLKQGSLRALVATASLELGIDIGHVDLACQIGSPHLISTFLQRVGRSGHTVRGVPKGRLFPVSRDDLVECAALIRGVRQGELDRLTVAERSLDVLAQQIVAEVACEEATEDELFGLVRRAYPYRRLERRDFDEVVRMVAEGFATRRGRRGALVHHDVVNGRLRGRRGARLTAITSGGAIPETADYRVVLEPEDTFIGTVNEDFAIESMAGDVFQLGNASWRIVQVKAGTVRVADARGEPPTIPFWFGEAPGRSPELSEAVSELRRDVAERLTRDPDAPPGPELGAYVDSETGSGPDAAAQIVTYLAESQRILGVIPTQRTLVLERFFDESGGMQLVLHAPFGSRINRAWGLALRKRFCRQFNFELQAAATEEGLLLSLGPQHSFPLADVFRYLHPATVRDVLVQALLDAPMFQTRWRWNATISLAVPRSRQGRKVPPQLQRMQADDLMAAVFPDAAACLENIAGDREIPDHPLVTQTITDCLQDAMDLSRLTTILERIASGDIACVARDTPEPSPLCHELLSARPYAFLDDAPLEERRAQAVYARRALEPSRADALGALDGSAIARVADEAWPDVRNADELHDGLLTAGFAPAPDRTSDGGNGIPASRNAAARAFEEATGFFGELCASRRAATVTTMGSGRRLWVAAERLPEVRAVFAGPAGGITINPAIDVPARLETRTWTPVDALAELLRSRLSVLGPTHASALADSLGVAQGCVDEALLALEQDGAILRGAFTPGARELEWCDRRLLARIHRYTLNRLRAEIEPVSPADFMRFLFSWQHVLSTERLAGPDGLRGVMAQLEGYELPAAAWERDVLPARLSDYAPATLDVLCLTGQVAWGRLGPGARLTAVRSRSTESLDLDPDVAPARPIRSTPVAFFLREHLHAWRRVRPRESELRLRPPAVAILAALRMRGASFLHELCRSTALTEAELEAGLAELVAAGAVTADGFAGLRALLRRRSQASGARRGLEAAGRWSLLVEEPSGPRSEAATFELTYDEADVEEQARTLLRRYGVVFRRLLERETGVAPWRDLARAYRRLEARGEIRGGRFVDGMAGEQFALAEAVGLLRAVRRTGPTGGLVALSAADPLNLAGIVTPGPRVAAVARSRLVFHDGVPLSALEGDYVRPLADYEAALAPEVARLLAGRPVPAVRQGYVGR